MKLSQLCLKQRLCYYADALVKGGGVWNESEAQKQVQEIFFLAENDEEDLYAIFADFYEALATEPLSQMAAVMELEKETGCHGET